MRALRPRNTAIRPRRLVVSLAGSGAVASVGVFAVLVCGAAALRPRRLFPVVRPRPPRAALFPYTTLFRSITAVLPGRLVVGLADARAVAGVGVVALGVRRAAARRSAG